MQKSLMTVALRATMAGMAFLALGAAQAQTAATSINSGYIDFAGTITASTCIVKQDDQTKLVPMPTVKPADFADVGDLRGEKSFTITLEKCTTNTGGATTLPTKAIVTFSGGNITANGRLKNNGDAQGVEIELKAGTANPLTTPTEVTILPGNTPLNFSAAYYATQKPVTQGAVLSRVNFNITYQ